MERVNVSKKNKTTNETKKLYQGQISILLLLFKERIALTKGSFITNLDR